MALDYAYKCNENGQLKCYNTHGSVNPDDWDVVNNMSNCEGTYKPDCGSIVNAPNRAVRLTTVNVGKKLGLSKNLVSKYEFLARYRGQMLAYLRQMRIKPKNNNDIYEIAALYAASQPYVRNYIKGAEIDAALGAVYGTKESFDFGAIFSAIADVIGGIIDGVNEASNIAELQQWYTQFGNYMQTDFADIQNQYERGGPDYAISWLTQLKGTSWKDLKAYNDNWLAQKGMAKPQQIVDLQNKQNELEAQLRAEAASLNMVFVEPQNCLKSSGCTTIVPVGQKITAFGGSVPTGNTIPDNRTTPSPNGEPTPKEPFDLMKFINENLILIAVAAIVLVFLLRKK